MLYSWGRQLVLMVVFLLCGCSETPEQLFQRGYAAFERQDNRELQACLNRLSDAAPESDHSLMLGALVSARGGDPLTALKLMSRIDEHGPLRQLLLRHGGRIYHEAGRLRDAARMVDQLTGEFPDDVSGHRLAGAIYYDLGAFDFAIRHLTRVTELAPGDFRPWWLLGTMYLDFDRYKDTADVLRKALELNPPDEPGRDITSQLAEALIQDKRYAEALELLSGMPMTAVLFAHKAECFIGLDDRDAAERAVNQALQLDEKNRSALSCKAELLKTAGADEAALAVYARLVETDPYDLEARYQYGLMLKAAGDDAASRENLKEWERLTALTEELTSKNRQSLDRPFDTELQTELAELCEQLGKTELAEMWRRAAAGTQAQKAAEPADP